MKRLNSSTKTSCLRSYSSSEAIISVFDDRTREELDKEAVEKIDKYYLDAFLGDDNLKNLVGFDLIFRSPSCMPFKPELEEEKKRGAILTTEIEMVLRLSQTIPILRLK